MGAPAAQPAVRPCQWGAFIQASVWPMPGCLHARNMPHRLVAEYSSLGTTGHLIRRQWTQRADFCLTCACTAV